MQVPSLRLRLVERKEGSAAAAFGRLAAVVFVDQETIQRGQQKGTKPALMRIKICKPVLFEQPRKKFLREILRIFWSVAPLPYIRIEGVPVGAAQLFQGLGSARRVASCSCRSTRTGSPAGCSRSTAAAR